MYKTFFFSDCGRCEESEMEKLTSLMCLAVICASGTAMDAPEFVYHNYTQLTLYLSDVAQSYPNITCLYSIGTSVEGEFLLQVLKSFCPNTLEVQFYKSFIGHIYIYIEYIKLHYLRYCLSL